MVFGPRNNLTISATLLRSFSPRLTQITPLSKLKYWFVFLSFKTVHMPVHLLQAPIKYASSKHHKHGFFYTLTAGVHEPPEIFVYLQYDFCKKNPPGVHFEQGYFYNPRAGVHGPRGWGPAWYVITLPLKNLNFNLYPPDREFHRQGLDTLQGHKIAPQFQNSIENHHYKPSLLI